MSNSRSPFFPATWGREAHGLTSTLEGRNKPQGPLQPTDIGKARRDAIMNQEFFLAERGSYVPDRIFLDYGQPTSDVGWKLHVIKPPGLSIDRPDLPANYQRLLRYFFVKKIPHKIVGSLAGLERMERNPGQVGKFITIYPADTEQMQRIADIIEALIPENAVGNDRLTPAEDHPVGARGLIGARWGGLTGPNTVDKDGKIVRDARTEPCPEWVKNPFVKNSPGTQDGWMKFPPPPKKEDDDPDETARQALYQARLNRRGGGGGGFGILAKAVFPPV